MRVESSAHLHASARPRSTEQHRRFFGLVAALYSAWPEGHRFRPESAEHLRAWLLVNVRHSHVAAFEMSDNASEVASLIPVIMATMRGEYAWAKAIGKELRVCMAKSIAYDKCPHDLFVKVCADVDDLIMAETGIDPDRLLAEKEKAA